MYWSLCGILIGLAILIYSSLKGIHFALASIISTLVVALFSSMPFAETYSATYMTGYGNWFTNMVPVLFFGAIFAKAIDITGLAASVAETLVKKLGAKYVIVAVMLAGFLLGISGVHQVVAFFMLYPLALVAFKRANMSKYILPAAVCTGGFLANTLPWFATQSNLILAKAFDVTVGAAPVIGVVCGVLLCAMNVVYLSWAAGRTKAKGQEFTPDEGDEAILSGIDEEYASRKSLINPWLMIVPLAVIVILLNVAKWPGWICLACGTIAALLVGVTRIKGKLLKGLRDAVDNTGGAVFTMGAIVAFGTVVMASPAYELIQNFLANAAGGNPYMYAFLTISIIAATTGSGSASIGTAITLVPPQVAAMGGSAAAALRVTAFSSIVFDSLPHGPPVVMCLRVCNSSHKKGYFPIFITTVVNPLIVTLLAILMATIGIN